MIACIAEGYHFCVVCRMMRSIYTLCGFEKNNSVGFCGICEFCGKPYLEFPRKQYPKELQLTDLYTLFIDLCTPSLI